MTFNNNATQKERAQVLRDTMHNRAAAEADDVRGRWAQINKASVIGATPVPTYPAGPNWSADPVGVEPPLGIDVNALEPTGEAFEIEKSSAASPASGSVHSPDPLAVETLAAQGDDDATSLARRPPPRRRRP